MELLPWRDSMAFRAMRCIRKQSTVVICEYSLFGDSVGVDYCQVYF